MNSREVPWKRGRLQVYMGNGKGKTTAALGLALRAAGAGAKVFIAQFAKGRKTSELAALERLSDVITIRQYGRGSLIRGEPGPEDIEGARVGLEEAARIIASGEYPLVILDEANVAVHLGLFSADDLLAVIESRPEHVELVITGRCADPRVVDAADLVTEMREVKHYYNQGVPARKGIDK